MGAGPAALAGSPHSADSADSAAATGLTAGAGAQPSGALTAPCRCPAGVMWQHQTFGRMRRCLESAFVQSKGQLSGEASMLAVHLV